MAFPLYGTKVAYPDHRAKLDVNLDPLRWDIGNEYYFPIDDCMESQARCSEVLLDVEKLLKKSFYQNLHETEIEYGDFK